VKKKKDGWAGGKEWDRQEESRKVAGEPQTTLAHEGRRVGPHGKNRVCFSKEGRHSKEEIGKARLEKRSGGRVAP